MRRTEAVIEQPTFARPIDTTTHQGTRFGELLTKYGTATQFVSSFEGMRSFPSYAEIVRRGPNMLPAIAIALNHGPKQIGLTLAFEDIQANLVKEGWIVNQITADAKTLGEKRENILTWAEEESVIGIRSQKERASEGANLFSILEKGAMAHMTPEQLREYQDPPRTYSRYGEHRRSSLADLVLPHGQEILVHLDLGSSNYDSRPYQRITVDDYMSRMDSYHVELLFNRSGEQLVDAEFRGEKYPESTRGSAREIKAVARKLFGTSVSPAA